MHSNGCRRTEMNWGSAGGAENARPEIARLEKRHQTAGLENAGLEKTRRDWLWRDDQA